MEKLVPIIGNDVWIGANVTLLLGVKIEDGVVIPVESVITRDVVPYLIIGGNPAKLIKKRFKDDICERLLASKWWEYKFTSFGNMDISNPEKFLEEFDKNKHDLKKWRPRKINLYKLIQKNKI